MPRYYEEPSSGLRRELDELWRSLDALSAAPAAASPVRALPVQEPVSAGIVVEDETQSVRIHQVSVLRVETSDRLEVRDEDGGVASLGYGGLRTISRSGSPQLVGDVTLTGSGAVTLTQSGQTIDISVSSGVQGAYAVHVIDGTITMPNPSGDPIPARHVCFINTGGWDWILILPAASEGEWLMVRRTGMLTGSLYLRPASGDRIESLSTDYGPVLVDRGLFLVARDETDWYAVASWTP